MDDEPKEPTLTEELKELIDVAVEAAAAGDESAQDWIDSLPEEVYDQWVEEELD